MIKVRATKMYNGMVAVRSLDIHRAKQEGKDILVTATEIDKDKGNKMLIKNDQKAELIRGPYTSQFGSEPYDLHYYTFDNNYE